MKFGEKDWLTVVLGFATLFAVILTCILLWGAGLFRPGGYFLGLEDLEHVGAFVGGFFTPLAVAWAARGFLLQRQQMIDTLDFMRDQNEIQRDTLNRAIEQMHVEREKATAAMDPHFTISKAGSSTGGAGGSVYKFKITNLGNTAVRFCIEYKIFGESLSDKITCGPAYIDRPLANSQSHPFDIKIPYGSRLINDIKLAIVVLSAQRLDHEFSRYTFQADKDFQFVLVKTELSVYDTPLH